MGNLHVARSGPTQSTWRESQQQAWGEGAVVNMLVFLERSQGIFRVKLIIVHPGRLFSTRQRTAVFFCRCRVMWRCAIRDFEADQLRGRLRLPARHDRRLPNGAFGCGRTALETVMRLAPQTPRVPPLGWVFARPGRGRFDDRTHFRTAVKLNRHSRSALESRECACSQERIDNGAHYANRKKPRG